MLTLLESFGNDFRHAVRSLRRSGGFTAAVVVTMALGIGAATVTFSVVYHLLIAPLPYKDVNRSVVFGTRALTNTGGWNGRGSFSARAFQAFRDQNHVFEDLIGAQTRTVLLEDGASTRLFRGAYATANTIDFFGIPPVLGRSFVAGDGLAGAPGVFAINHRLWQEEFGGDPGIVGRTFVLDGELKTLVAVMPRRFNAFSADLWMATDVRLGGVGFAPVGRLKPGIALETAASDLDAIAHRFVRDNPGESTPDQFVVVVRTFLDNLLGDFKRTLYALVGAVFLLLMIACSNVINLMLARASVRDREIALRASIGATRGRLVRQLLVESFVLAAGAAAGGIVLAVTGVKIVVALMPPGTIPVETEILLNLPILLVSIGLAVVTMLCCGLVPALQLVRGDLQARLAGSAKGSSGTVRHGALRAGLVVAEVAVSIMLVTGAGLLMKGFFVLTRVDLGFNPRDVMYIRPFFPRDYDTADEKNAFTRTLLEHLRALPGVTSVAESMLVPPLTHDWSETIIPGKPHVERWETRIEICSEGYFQTIGLPLVRGRLFSESDVLAKRIVTVVNQQFVRRYFPDEDPLGKRVKFQVLDRPFLDAPHDTYFEIVGVVADHKTWGGEWQSVPQAFLPYSIQGFSFRTFLARTAVDPHSLLPAARQAVWAIDPRVGISASGSIEQSLRDFYRDPQFDLATLGAFAGLGLALVAVGVFSVMAFTVSVQKHEIGVRMAIGAQRIQILRMILLRGLRLVGAGTIVGLVAAYFFSSALVSQNPAVSMTDPLTFSAVAAIVVLVGLAASLLPARQATRVDPLVTLRAD